MLSNLKHFFPAAALLALAGCSADPLKPTAAEPPATVGVETMVVARQPRETLYEATGSVRARFNATLSSKLMSRVSAVLAREGDEVRQGQTLVALDARELAAGVQVARANLSASAVGVDNARTVREMESRTSAARVSQAEAATLQSKAALAAAQSKLDLVLAGTRSQEKTQARLAVVQADASLKLAKTQLERAARLVTEGALPKKSLEEAQTAYEVALAQRDTALQAEKIAQEGSRKEEIQAARDGVEQAKAALVEAKANVAQAKAATLQTRVRTQEIRSAQAQVSQSSAALRSAQVSLGYSTVSAPFDGRVVQRAADPGAMALPGSPLLVLEGGPLRLEAVVPESVLPRLKLGQEVSIELDALQRRFTAKVDEIVPQGSAASHTFVVKLLIPDGHGVRSGMFGRAFIVTGKSQVISIPSGAVWEREGLRCVYVVNLEGIVRLRIVTVGRAEEGRSEILSGLSPGDRVVVKGREGIMDGAKVAAR